MKKVSLFMVISLLTLISVVFLFACNPSQPKDNEYTIAFNSNGGVQNFNIKTDGKSTVDLPSPSKEGYVFEGWFYDDNSFENEFVTNSLVTNPISKNITVYAKWRPAQFEYTVTYDTNGGSDIPSLSVLEGDSLNLPSPTKSRFIFEGWYTASDLTTQFNATTMPSQNITLYAKWSRIFDDTYFAERIEYLDDYQGMTIMEIENEMLLTLLEELDATEFKNEVMKAYFLLYEDINIQFTFVFSSSTKAKEFNASIADFGSKSLVSFPVYQEGTAVSIFSAYDLILGELYQQNDSTFLLSLNEYVLLKSNTTAESYSVPSQINSKPVTAIFYLAFEGLSNLNSVNLPDSIVSIGRNAFDDTGIYNNATNLVYADNWLITSKNKNITSLTLENNTKGIADNALISCNLESVMQTASLQYIGNNAFKSNESLSNFVFSNNLKRIGNEAFYRTGFTNITIPESVEFLGDGAFSRCRNMETFELRANIDINNDFFDNCEALTSIIVSENNPYLKSIDGVLYNKSVTEIHTLPEAKTGEYAFPETITTFDSLLFKYSSIDSVVLSNGFTSIPEGGFSYTNVTSVRMPNTLTSIGNYAFQYSSISEIELSDSLTEIGSSAFRYCYNLTRINLPSGIVSIGEYAFYETGITTMFLPASIQSVGYKAFKVYYSEFGSAPIFNLLMESNTEHSPNWFETMSSYPYVVYNNVNIALKTFEFICNGSNETIQNITDIYLEYEPQVTKNGLNFWGWYDNADFEGEDISFPYFNSMKTTLYARFEQGPRPMRMIQKDIPYSHYLNQYEYLIVGFVAPSDNSYRIQISTPLYSVWSEIKSFEGESINQTGSNNYDIELEEGKFYYIIVEFDNSSSVEDQIEIIIEYSE